MITKDAKTVVEEEVDMTVEAVVNGQVIEEEVVAGFQTVGETSRDMTAIGNVDGETIGEPVSVGNKTGTEAGIRVEAEVETATATATGVKEVAETTTANRTGATDAGIVTRDAAVVREIENAIAAGSVEERPAEGGEVETEIEIGVVIEVQAGNGTVVGHVIATLLNAGQMIQVVLCLKGSGKTNRDGLHGGAMLNRPAPKPHRHLPLEATVFWVLLLLPALLNQLLQQSSSRPDLSCPIRWQHRTFTH